MPHEYETHNSHSPSACISTLEKLEWDASCCFICDLRPDGTIESFAEHMHKMHGIFIPNPQYLKDPRGLLSYLNLKVFKKEHIYT